MKTSPFQIMKDGWLFLWNHKKVLAAVIVFGFVAVGMCVALVATVGTISWLIFGTDRLLLAFHSIAAGIIPHLTPWVAIALLAILFMFILLILFYPRVCSAVYILHALRKKPVTITTALKEGWRLTIAAWEVILGLTLVPVSLLMIGLVLLFLNMMVAIVFAALAVGCMLWFYMATYFIEQLVADGVTDFSATIATSWNYVQRCWWQIMGILFFLWLTNVLVSAFLPAMFFSFFGFILSAWYATAANKIYLIVRSESDYKYSSE